MTKPKKYANKNGYWVCKINNEYYLHAGYKKYKINYNPKYCYFITRRMYHQLDKESGKGRSKIKE